jgi:hypothetical protein
MEESTIRNNSASSTLTTILIAVFALNLMRRTILNSYIKETLHDLLNKSSKKPTWSK